MSLASLLDIAKTGLIAQQTSLTTTGHNIANVNTPGFSKQHALSSSRTPVQLDVGSVGTGTNILEVTRDYDRFVTSTLFDKTSIMSGQDTRQAGLKIIESILNEVDENGLNGMLDNFWAAWDDLANVAEGMPERTTLLDNAALFVAGLRDRYDSLVKMAQDIDLNIETSIKDINKVSAQIAELNVRIVSSEASHHPANDLRDQRDKLVQDLSELTDITYFETKRGSYTVLIGGSKPLVEDEKSWNLAFLEQEVNWIGQDGSRTVLRPEDIAKGTLGGWLDVKERVSPADPAKLTGSVVNTVSGDAIRESTRWDEIDGVVVSGGFSIRISGTRGDGMPLWTYDHTTDPPGTTPPFDVSATFTYNPGPPETNATVGDFLRFIEDHYPVFDENTGLPMLDANGEQINRVRARLEDGRIAIDDINPGEHDISFQIEDISGGVNGLELGKFDGHYPINYIGTLNRFGTELIKAVNSQHAQGVGLVPLTETTGVYEALNSDQPIGYRSSGFVFSDEVESGQFEIWLYDDQGNVIDYDPVTPEVNDPLVIHVQKNTTSLDDIIDEINSAEFSGPPLGDRVGLRARNLGGRLVLQVDGTTDVAGFAFGRDTSGALLAMGVNAFFTGTDASNININPALYDDNRLIAAARTGPRGAESTASMNPLRDSGRPLGLEMQDGTFTLRVYDEAGMPVDLDPARAGVNPLRVEIDASVTSIQDIADRINEVDGLVATIHNGRLNISIDNDNVTDVPKWKSVTLGDDTSGVLDYLGVDQAHMAPPGVMTSRNAVTAVNMPLASVQSGLEGYNDITVGNITIKTWKGEAVKTDYIHIDPETETFETLRDKLNAIDGINAAIRPVVIGGQTTYKLEWAGTDPSAIVAIESDETGIFNALGMGTLDSEVRGNYSVDDLTAPLDSFRLGIDSGSFNVYLYDEDGYVLSDRLEGSVSNTSGSAPITPGTSWDAIDGFNFANGTSPGAPVEFYITYTGKDHQGNTITGTYQGTTADSVNDFLTAVNNSFANPSPPPPSFAVASLDSTGRLVLTSSVSGKAVGFQIEEVGAVHRDAGDSVSGLDFGTFNGNFNIEVNSGYDGLEDIASRLDALEDIKAHVTDDGRIVMETEGRAATFVLADDTTGHGDDPGFLAVTGLATPAGGELSPADNRNALSIRDISRQSIDNLDDATLNEAYQGLVGTIGIDSRGFQMDYEFVKATVNDLEARRQEISGVALDEEMTDLLRFQHAYSAASKLIKAADEMFVTLLQVK
jgi:flagellar hook-associated protein FlgK